MEESGHQLSVETLNRVLSVTLCSKDCEECVGLPAYPSVCLPVYPVSPLDFVGME